MRFNQIIHPETVLGKRGSASLIEIYKTILPVISYEGFGKSYSVSDKRVKEFDNNMSDHMMIVKRFLLDGAKCYHVNRDFLTEIAKVDRAIPIDRLPSKFSGYISFAKDTLRDETDFVQGAYVYVGPAGETSFANTPEMKSVDQKVLWVSYLGQSDDVAALRVGLENKKMSDIVGDLNYQDYFTDVTKQTTPEIKKCRETIFRTLINLVLYIHQPDPELIRIRPIKDFTNSQVSKIRQAEGKGETILSQCELPLTFINWRWQRPVGLHSVTGHFKWQACGTGHMERKLIWIDTYERGKKDSECGEKQ